MPGGSEVAPWAEPDDEVHAFVNQLERPVGTYLYGRRMDEVMKAWETLGTDRDPDFIRDFAEMWRAAEKVVYSKSLQTASTTRTRITRVFKSEAVRGMKSAADHDISIGGASLAAFPPVSGWNSTSRKNVDFATRRSTYATEPPRAKPPDPRMQPPSASERSSCPRHAPMAGGGT